MRHTKGSSSPCERTGGPLETGFDTHTQDAKNQTQRPRHRKTDLITEVHDEPIISLSPEPKHKLVDWRPFASRLEAKKRRREAEALEVVGFALLCGLGGAPDRWSGGAMVSQGPVGPGNALVAG